MVINSVISYKDRDQTNGGVFILSFLYILFSTVLLLNCSYKLIMSPYVCLFQDKMLMGAKGDSAT